MSKDHAIGFGMGVFAGAIIGGVVALLYAPKSGKETRRLIRDAASDVADTVKEATGGVIATVRETAAEASRKGHATVKAHKG